MSPTLDQAAAELYAVEPGQFTAERTRLTGEARSAGDADTAKAIGGLRRPTTSAWLVNQLVRGEQGAADEVEHLEQLGQDLREAQATLDAVRMRELTKQRHQLVGALVHRAGDVAAVAGQKMSAAVRRELEETLGAAVADEQASLAVMSGRLTRALTYAGFGEVDVTEATATPLNSAHPNRAARSGGLKRSDSKLAPKPSAQGEAGSEINTAPGPGSKHGSGARAEEGPAAPGSSKPPTPEAKTIQPTRPEQPHAEKQTEKHAARRAQAEELVARTRADADTAEDALRQKEHELDEATSAQAGLQTRLNQLQAEIVTVRSELNAGDRRVSQAERSVQREERNLKEVAKARDRAEAALDHLDHLDQP